MKRAIKTKERVFYYRHTMDEKYSETLYGSDPCLVWRSHLDDLDSMIWILKTYRNKRYMVRGHLYGSKKGEVPYGWEITE